MILKFPKPEVAKSHVFFIFFACSLKTVVSKISAGFSKCGYELGGSVPVKVPKSSCP